MIRAMKNMDKDTRDALTFAAGLLFRSNVQARVESWQEEAEEKREDRVRRKKP